MAVRTKHTRSNIYIIDIELWTWAKYNTKIQGLNSISEYIFNLIKNDKESLNQH